MNEVEPYECKPILDMTLREVLKMEAKAQRSLGLPSTYIERFKVSGDIAYLKDVVKGALTGSNPYTALEVLEMLDKKVMEADGVNGVDLWQKS